jgi:hypothetical protein
MPGAASGLLDGQEPGSASCGVLGQALRQVVSVTFGNPT